MAQKQGFLCGVRKSVDIIRGKPHQGGMLNCLSGNKKGRAVAKRNIYYHSKKNLDRKIPSIFLGVHMDRTAEEEERGVGG